MIKIITALVCAFAAMLMLIVSMATTYWLQWVIPSEGVNITHFRGLARQCFEVRHNETDALIKENCGDWFEGGFPDWTGAVIAFLVLALLCHFVAFVLAMVNACRKGEPFPVFWVCGLFMIAAIFVIIGLLVYTFSNWKNDVYFSWSYGGGWSTVALSIIAFVLIMADR
ncbi:claudin domain-containing protein 2 isoform X2 [Nematostella vectensis]|uniref:claudin domain-containing protein 2 isoform X2 n=1 Tax=Nematostella vectensis TaxID=45351 RepID=UPI0020774F22|nr:claudin domain-containing protein 2 isoform X2 [Nematostella vectensis]